MPVRERVSLARCAGYDLEEVEASLRAALAPLGGIEAFVRPGQRVVLKPNLLRPASPDAAATTHPAVVAAVARLVVAAGAEALILDSSGGPNSTAYLTMVHRTTGMTWAAEASGARLVADLHATQVPLAKGLILHRVDLVREAIEADVLINLPKLKTHGLTGLTVAVKNLLARCRRGQGGLSWLHAGPGGLCQGLLDVSSSAPRLHRRRRGGHGGQRPFGRDPAGGGIPAGAQRRRWTQHCRPRGGSPVGAPRGWPPRQCSGRTRTGVAGSPKGCRGHRSPAGGTRRGHAPRGALFGRIATGGSPGNRSSRPRRRCTGRGSAPGIAVDASPWRTVAAGARARMDAARCIRCYCCLNLPSAGRGLRKPSSAGCWAGSSDLGLRVRAGVGASGSRRPWAAPRLYGGCLRGIATIGDHGAKV